jgi:uncharacterized membrane protein
MKSIFNFIKITVKGGIFVFFPLFFILYALKKIFDILFKIANPFLKFFSIESILGKVGVSILIVLFLILISFIAGLLMRLHFFKTMNDKIDSYIGLLFPQYNKLKDQVDVKIKDKLDKPL